MGLQRRSNAMRLLIPLAVVYVHAAPYSGVLPASISAELATVFPTGVDTSAYISTIFSNKGPAYTSVVRAQSSIVAQDPANFPGQLSRFHISTGSVGSSYAESVLATAFPSSLNALYTTNKASWTAVINSEFAGTSEPAWFKSMPTNVQAYYEQGSTTSLPVPTVTQTVVKTVTATATGGLGGLIKPTSSSTPSSTPPPSGGGGLSTGAKAGIGAGVGIAALLAIIGLVWFCLRRHKKNKNKTTNSVAQQPEMTPAPGHGADPHLSQGYYSGVPQQQQYQQPVTTYYADQPNKYEQPYGGSTGMQQQAYQQSLRQSGYYPQSPQSPPPQSMSPPPQGLYHGEKNLSPSHTGATGAPENMSPPIGEGTMASGVSNLSREPSTAQHHGDGGPVATELPGHVPTAHELA